MNITILTCHLIRPSVRGGLMDRRTHHDNFLFLRRWRRTPGPLGNSEIYPAIQLPLAETKTKTNPKAETKR